MTTPFDFIKSVSHTKEELIRKEDSNLETSEKEYNAYMVNKGLSYFQDTVLFANEMNTKHWLYNDAQYRYYLASLRPKQRFSKWFKPEKDKTLDNIQTYYQCNRMIAKQYMSTLSNENLLKINNIIESKDAMKK